MPGLFNRFLFASLNTERLLWGCIMLEKIGSNKAKTKLPEILRRVQRGESFTITKKGKAVADLVPSQIKDASNTDAAIKNIMKAKKRILSNGALKDLKLDGRK